jgi:uncharacterized membrane protein YdbT with pleckstrin-like domain
MNYIEKSKLQGESLVKIYKPSKYIYSMPLLLLIIGISMLFNIIELEDRTNTETSDAGGYLTAACLVALYYIKTMKYYVTNKRVVSKHGFGTNVKEFPLDKIETVQIDEGVIGKLLGFSDIKVTGVGNEKLQFSFIEDAINVKTLISQNIENY